MTCKLISDHQTALVNLLLKADHKDVEARVRGITDLNMTLKKTLKVGLLSETLPSGIVKDGKVRWGT